MAQERHHYNRFQTLLQNKSTPNQTEAPAKVILCLRIYLVRVPSLSAAVFLGAIPAKTE